MRFNLPRDPGQQIVEPRLRVDRRVDDHLAAQGHPRRFFQEPEGK
jgi:hypothetical protein